MHITVNNVHLMGERWVNETRGKNKAQNSANIRTRSTVTGTLIPNSSNSDIIPRFRAIKPTRFDCGVHFSLLVFVLAFALELKGVGANEEKRTRGVPGIRSIRGR